MSEVLEFPQSASLREEQAQTQAGTVAVVGLGYVGLPLAVAFGKERPTIGFDLSAKRVESVRQLVDATGEVETAELMQAKHLRATADPAELAQAQFIIVAVPTPLDAGNRRISRRCARRARRSGGT